MQGSICVHFLSDAANSDFGKPTNTDDSIDLVTELVCDPLSVSFEGELAGDTHKLVKNSVVLVTGINGKSEREYDALFIAINVMFNSDDVAFAKIKAEEFQGMYLRILKCAIYFVYAVNATNEGSDCE